ncbi:MAG: leucyl/phenylalanyl-tRNA--protein transferase [Flavobacteriales bacterium]
MELTPELLLNAYRQGLFPMGNEAGDVDWYCPDPRAVIPLEKAVPGRTMQRVLRKGRLRLSLDGAFERVMRACGEREETWITEEMVDAYTALHRTGHAHSAEAWEGAELVGGIYGVSIGAAFFGESMFTRSDNAGKAAFHHLVDRLRAQGFVLFDSQIINDFTRTLGALEIPFTEFQVRLAKAVAEPDRW